MPEKIKKIRPLAKFALRALSFIFLSFLLIFISALIIFRTIGLPDIIENIIRKKLAEADIRLEFDNIKLTKFSGGRFENTKFSHRTDWGKIILHSQELDLTVNFSENKFQLADIKVNDGNLKIIINSTQNEFDFSRLFAEILLDQKSIHVKEITTNTLGTQITIKGKIDDYLELIKNFSHAKTQNNENAFAAAADINSLPALLRNSQDNSFAKFAPVKEFIEKHSKDSSLNAEVLISPSEIKISASYDLPEFYEYDTKVKNARLNLFFQNSNPAELLKQVRAKINFQCSAFANFAFSAKNLSLETEFEKKSDNDTLIFNNLYISSPDNFTINSKGSIDLESKNLNADFKIQASSLEQIPELSKILSQNDIIFTAGKSAASLDGTICGNFTDYKSLQGKTRITAKNFAYKKIDFKNIDTILDIKSNKIHCEDFKVLLNDDTSASGSFIYNTESRELILSAETTGNIETLLAEDITGSKLPAHLKGIKFSSKADDTRISAKINAKKKADNLNLNGSIHVSAKNLKLRNIAIDELNSNVDLKPDQILIPTLQIVIQDKKASAEIYCNLNDKEKFGHDANTLFLKGSSELNAEDFLEIALPGININWISFYGPAGLSVNARIPLDGNNLNINGIIERCSLKLNKLNLRNASAKLEYKNNTLAITELCAQLCRGILNSNLNYSFESMSGDFSLSAKDIDLNRLVSDLQGKNSSLYSGKLASYSKANFKINNGKFELYGNGNFTLSESELLKIPVISELISILTQRLQKILQINWTKLNTVEGNFELKEQQIIFSEISSRGTVLALSGRGYYDWGEDYCDFYVAANPIRIQKLEGIMPARVIFDIAEKVFSTIELRYRGSKDNRRWEPATGIPNILNNLKDKIKQIRPND